MPDLLRRLEREVGPFADAAPSTKPTPRSAFSRALVRTAIAATVLVGLALAFAGLESTQVDTSFTAMRRPLQSAQDLEIVHLKDELMRAEVELKNLREERESARRTQISPSFWYEDIAALTYRSPWY